MEETCLDHFGHSVTIDGAIYNPINVINNTGDGLQPTRKVYTPSAPPMPRSDRFHPECPHCDTLS